LRQFVFASEGVVSAFNLNVAAAKKSQNENTKIVARLKFEAKTLQSTACSLVELLFNCCLFQLKQQKYVIKRHHNAQHNAIQPNET
jgi:hypothetical protein